MLGHVPVAISCAYLVRGVAREILDDRSNIIEWLLSASSSAHMPPADLVSNWDSFSTIATQWNKKI